MNELLKDDHCTIGDTIRVSPIDDDILAFKFVSVLNHEGHDVLGFELELFGTKWFDYRQMTPLGATRRYMDLYGDIYRKHYRINMDRRAAEHVKVFDADSIMSILNAADRAGQKVEARALRDARRNFVGCWRGRQCADAIGMPYEVYIDLAFEYRLNYWQQRHLPKPFHLYSEMVVEKVSERWEELQDRKLYISDEPAYLVQNYRDIAHQNDYHEWLFKQAFRRSNPPEFIARFVNEHALPYDKVLARIQPHLVEHVERYLQ